MKTVPYCIAVLCAACLMAQDAKHPAFHETNHAKAPAGLKPYKPVQGLSGHLRSVGADTMEQITKGWIDRFIKIYPDVKISMEANSSFAA